MAYDLTRPYTWEVPTDSPIGKRGLRRKDGYEKASGTAVYTSDITLPRMLYAKFLRSPYSQADIVSMDTSAAKALPGVIDIIRYDDDDIKDIKRSGSDPAPGSYTIYGLPGIADQHNHPMGIIVIAESEEIVDRALKLVDIQWEEKTFYIDQEESMAPGATEIWYNTEPYPRPLGGNIIRDDVEEHGDMEAGFAESDHVIEWRTKREENTVAGVEPQSCVAYYNEDGYLDLWIKTQPTNAPSELNSAGLADYAKITLNVPYQGAWFGGVSWLHWCNLFIMVATVVAKRVKGTPVKLIYDECNFYNMGDDYGVYIYKVGFNDDGTIEAAECDMYGCRFPIEKFHNSTKVPNVKSHRLWPFVNRNNSCCFRDGSVPCTAITEIFTRVAGELDMDPTDIAMINDGCEGDDWETVKQYRIDNMYQNPETQSLEVVIAAGKEAMDWDNKWHLPGTKQLPNGKMHGLGFMSVNSWHGFNNMNSAAKVTVSGGIAYIHGVFSDIGVDAARARALTLAASSGLKYDDIVCRHFGNELSLYNHSQPGGSFGTENNTGQMIIMGLDLKQRIIAKAIAERPGGWFSPPLPPLFPDTTADELDVKDSVVFRKSNPDDSFTVKEVMGTGNVSVTPVIPPRAIGYKYLMARQAHFLEVEVDIDTGEIEITKAVCVNDVGTVIDKEGAEGQQYGGAAMGIGKSLTEEIIRDPMTGIQLNANLIGYPIVTMLDLGPIDCLLPETRSGNNCFGLTGIGESIGCTFSSLTVAAIYNATGKWVDTIPTTPPRVLKALGKA